MVDHMRRALKFYAEGPSFKVLCRVICVYLNNSFYYYYSRGTEEVCHSIIKERKKERKKELSKKEWKKERKKDRKKEIWEKDSKE